MKNYKSDKLGIWKKLYQMSLLTQSSAKKTQSFAESEYRFTMLCGSLRIPIAIGTLRLLAVNGFNLLRQLLASDF